MEDSPSRITMATKVTKLAMVTMVNAVYSHTEIISNKFNSLLSVCCINSQKANYRCSTREDKIINITNNNNQIIETTRL
jgi:hypothetical protein